MYINLTGIAYPGTNLFGNKFIGDQVSKQLSEDQVIASKQPSGNQVIASKQPSGDPVIARPSHSLSSVFNRDEVLRPKFDWIGPAALRPHIDWDKNRQTGLIPLKYQAFGEGARKHPAFGDGTRENPAFGDGNREQLPLGLPGDARFYLPPFSASADGFNMPISRAPDRFADYSASGSLRFPGGLLSANPFQRDRFGFGRDLPLGSAGTEEEFLGSRGTEQELSLGSRGPEGINLNPLETHQHEFRPTLYNKLPFNIGLANPGNRFPTNPLQSEPTPPTIPVILPVHFMSRDLTTEEPNTAARELVPNPHRQMFKDFYEHDFMSTDNIDQKDPVLLGS